MNLRLLTPAMRVFLMLAFFEKGVGFSNKARRSLCVCGRRLSIEVADRPVRRLEKVPDPLEHGIGFLKFDLESKGSRKEGVLIDDGFDPL